MTVKDLKAFLKEYNNNAKVIIVDWSDGTEYEPSIGSDDENEYTEFCRIGLP